MCVCARARQSSLFSITVNFPAQQAPTDMIFTPKKTSLCDQQPTNSYGHNYLYLFIFIDLFIYR